MESVTPTRSRRATVFLLCLLALFIAKSLSMSFVIPLGQGPDEEAHVDYVHWLTLKKAPPSIGDPLSSVTFQLYGMGFPPLRFETTSEGARRFQFYEKAERDWLDRRYVFDSVGRQTEGGQPALYYATCAVLTAPFRGVLGPLGYWHLARVVSIIFGCIAVCAAWIGGWKLFPANSSVIKSLPAIVLACHPMSSFVFSIVTNDAALIALTNIFFLQVIFRRPAWETAITASLLLLTKASAIAAIVWWALLILRKRRLQSILPIISSFILLFFYLLLTHPTGEALHYLTFTRQVFPEATHKLSIASSLWSLWSGLTANAWFEFGGVIGWLGMAMPPWWHIFRSALVLFIVAVVIVNRARLISILDKERKVFLGCLLFIFLWWLMLAAGGWQALRWTNNHTIQGRMFLPCLLPITLSACILVKNLLRPRSLQRFGFVVSIGCIVGCFWMTVMLPAQFYYASTGFVFTWESISQIAAQIAAAQPLCLNKPALWIMVLYTDFTMFVALAVITIVCAIRDRKSRNFV